MVERRKDLDKNTELINKLYMSGELTVNQLAKKFDCGANSIRRRLKQIKPTIVKRKDAHDWSHRIKLEYRRIETQCSQKDKEIILEFLEDCKSERLSPARLENYGRQLRTSIRFRHKDLVNVDRKDMKKIMNRIESTDFAEWTKQGYRICFKKFYRWYAIEKQDQVLPDRAYPDTVNFINTTIKESKKRLPDDLLNEDDVLTLISSTSSIRNKALIALLWDSGCRIGEALNLQLKHLNFDKHGGTVTLQGKTGSRKIRLVPSIPYLANLRQNHPHNTNPNAFLFVGEGSLNNGQRISYVAVVSMLRSLTEKSNIKKRVTAHSFRHARASNLAKKIKEPIMRELFGWTEKSQMTAVYVHLSGRDIDSAKLRADGVEIEETVDKESKLKPIKCIRCKIENPCTAKFCNSCGLVFDEGLAKTLEYKEKRASQVFKKLTDKNDFSISKDTIKEVLKEMIRSGEVRL